METAIDGDRVAGDEFHHEIGQAVLCRAAVYQTRDVRMIERGQDLALAQKSVAHEIRVHPRFDDLDRDSLPELLVVTLGLVNGSHPSPSDQTPDAVRPDALSGQIVVGFGGE